MAATLGQLDLVDETTSHVAAILEARPDFSIARYRSRILYSGEDNKDRIVAGLFKVGLAE